MKNKIIAVLLCFVVVSMLFGCRYSADNSGEQTTEAVSSTVITTTTTTAKKQTAKTTESSSAKPKTTAGKQTASNTVSHSKKTIEITTRGRRNTDLKKLLSVLFDGLKDRDSVDRTTTKDRNTNETSNKDDSISYCTLTIQCKEILAHPDRLKDGKEDYVPSSGYILKNCSVKYEDGDTVYDVLRRACRENGVSMRAKMTGYGMYVEGINNLFEKDCGGTSGWTYYVNGKFPTVAVSKYELHGGEVIEFKYVV